MFEDLYEIKVFETKVVVGFHELTDDLENKIYRKLSEKDFYTNPFEILNITKFKVKEMKVQNNVQVCLLTVTAEVLYPQKNKIITVKDFRVQEGNLICAFKRIQLIASLENHRVQEEYKVCIEDIKILGENILCVGEIVE